MPNLVIGAARVAAGNRPDEIGRDPRLTAVGGDQGQAIEAKTLQLGHFIFPLAAGNQRLIGGGLGIKRFGLDKVIFRTILESGVGIKHGVVETVARGKALF